MSIDPESGVSLSLGQLGVPDVSGLAFDRARGHLLGSTIGGLVLRIDLARVNATVVARTGLPLGGLEHAARSMPLRAARIR